MELDGVVFYGRLGHLALQMYGLDGELQRWRGARVLDCPGGPSSLAALLAAAGVEVMACDPLYGLSIAELRQRSIADLELSIAKSINSPMLRPGFDLEQVRRHHLEGLEVFLADRETYPERYVAASLPELPFASASFDLVLSGHLLFSYAPLAAGGLMAGAGFDLDWHRRALAELRRVSRSEIRLYPGHTQAMPAEPHPYAEALLAELPDPWHGCFAARNYDQGFSGFTHGLQLWRS
ncbi:MAG: class I SAM-dependent methyltransferase [Prochlorococcaceae cyanobacterium]